jgi:hypothetical protein
LFGLGKMSPTANWQLQPIVCSTRGNKSAPITCNNAAVKKIFEDKTVAPFGAGLYNAPPDANRLNLDLACTEEYTSWLEAVDEWAVSELFKRSTEFFKKKMSKEEIKAIFKASATPHSSNGIDFAPTMRTKINLKGLNAVKCWNPDKTTRNTPEEWRGASLQPEILVKGLWFMAGSVGVLFEVHNVIVEQEEETCPF